MIRDNVNSTFWFVCETIVAQSTVLFLLDVKSFRVLGFVHLRAHL